MTNPLRYLQARYALVYSDKRRADAAYNNGRLAQQDGRNVDADVMSALMERRAELAEELDDIAEQIRALADDDAAEGARQGAQEASHDSR